MAGPGLEAQCPPVNPHAAPAWEAQAVLLCVPTAPRQPPGRAARHYRRASPSNMSHCGTDIRNILLLNSAVIYMAVFLPLDTLQAEWRMHKWMRNDYRYLYASCEWEITPIIHVWQSHKIMKVFLPLPFIIQWESITFLFLLLHEAIYDCLYITSCFKGDDNIKAAWPQNGITDSSKMLLRKKCIWFLREISNSM